MKFQFILLWCVLALNAQNEVFAQNPTAQNPTKANGFVIAWEQGDNPYSLVLWLDETDANKNVNLKKGDMVISSPLLADPIYSPSLVVIPNRFRLGAEGDTPGRVITGDKSLGVYFPLAGRRRMKFKPGIVTTESEFSVGAVITPFTQTFTSVNNSAIADSDMDHQGVLLSTAIAATVQWQGVSLLLCPIGFDWGGGSMAETWSFNDHRWWWGFGIGADLRKLSSLIPKFKG